MKRTLFFGLLCGISMLSHNAMAFGTCMFTLNGTAQSLAEGKTIVVDCNQAKIPTNLLLPYKTINLIDVKATKCELKCSFGKMDLVGVTECEQGWKVANPFVLHKQMCVPEDQPKPEPKIEKKPEVKPQVKQQTKKIQTLESGNPSGLLNPGGVVIDSGSVSASVATNRIQTLASSDPSGLLKPGDMAGAGLATNRIQTLESGNPSGLLNPGNVVVKPENLILEPGVKDGAVMPGVGNKTISGVVYGKYSDGEETLIGATVSLNGIRNGVDGVNITATDSDGTFTLSGFDKNITNLTITYTGLKDATYTLNPNLTSETGIRIVLQENSEMLEEVVVLSCEKNDEKTGARTSAKIDGVCIPMFCMDGYEMQDKDGNVFNQSDECLGRNGKDMDYAKCNKYVKCVKVAGGQQVTKNVNIGVNINQPVVSIEQLRKESRARIISAGRTLDSIKAGFDTSVWKNKDGGFNTARLASDSIAGVVLGTAGGLITSNVIKKNQIKGGFEDIKCIIGGQTVADWGDEFQAGISLNGNY